MRLVQMSRLWLRSLVFLPALLACGGGGAGGSTGNPTPPAPIISSFSANPQIVASGGTTTLTATFTNGIGVVDQGVGTVLSGVGVTTPPVNATKTFTLSVTNGSQVVTAAVTVTAGGSIQTGSLATARYLHTATLLPNGKVLITGGTNGGALGSAELYDPGTGLFSNVGGLSPRYRHSALLLASGKVLIVGGQGSSSSYPAIGAEMFDPTTGAFSPTGGPTEHVFNNTSTLLPNGKVLTTGGERALGTPRITDRAESYDPATGVFTATGSLISARSSHTATVLLNGKVLITGGYTSTGGPSSPQLGIQSCELYDPDSGTFSYAGNMLTGRYAHSATLLQNGKVLLSGGYSSAQSTFPLSSSELYDPATGTSSTTGSMSVAYNLRSATLLPNGKVLVTGGSNGLSQTAIVELFDPATGLFGSVGSMLSARAGHTATLLPNGRVLVVGGSNNGFLSGISAAEVYIP